MAAKKKPKPIDESAIKKKPRKKKEAGEKAEAAPKAKKTRAKKEAEVVRLKIFWGVFNHQLKRVALFDFNPHFVQKIKEKVEEPTEKA
jgi:hypothetical protein